MTKVEKNAHANDLADEIRRKQAVITLLELQLSLLKKELDTQQGVKGQLKGLYRALDKRIINTLDTKGYKVKKKVRTVPLPKTNLSQDRKTLLLIARKHDAQKYFRYKSPRANMRFRYRLASKIYRTSRDAARKTVMAGYRAQPKPEAKNGKD